MDDLNSMPEFDFDAVFEVDDYLYFYRESLTPERSAAEVDALVKMLGLEAPIDILDLACGFGRHANRLATMGHKVTGIDRSPGFLEIARREAEVLGVEVDYRQGDMRQLDLGEQYDLVLLLFTAFGYFSDEQNLQVLRNIALSLKPGGRLVFDTRNRDSFIKDMLPAIVTEKEGNLMIDRLSFDPLSGRMTNRRLTIRDGVRKDRPFHVRLYNSQEVRALLYQAGMAVEAHYGGWDLQPLKSDSRRLITVARRQ